MKRSVAGGRSRWALSFSSSTSSLSLLLVRHANAHKRKFCHPKVAPSFDKLLKILIGGNIVYYLY